MVDIFYFKKNSILKQLIFKVFASSLKWKEKKLDGSLEKKAMEWLNVPIIKKEEAPLLDESMTDTNLKECQLIG